MNELEQRVYNIEEYLWGDYGGGGGGTGEPGPPDGPVLSEEVAFLRAQIVKAFEIMRPMVPKNQQDEIDMILEMLNDRPNRRRGRDGGMTIPV
ncbi:hypothetical protein OZN62_04280 [Aurantiacibacter sp. MUD11]|uniref:hypothetical protein n=1 Tax=Aurantiacibacter sp. MUD11 TaxID=3003265 RepID=UPI0022AAF87D|nr:hypothetical protein [Aurantiacibacter sp. MUD11]WAT18794.1 hypothetical protein OZN62_04280 [Aurantiacibacter sp. MUD11]